MARIRQCVEIAKRARLCIIHGRGRTAETSLDAQAARTMFDSLGVLP